MAVSDVGLISIVWMFLIVAGGWLLVNALVDMGGANIFRWIVSKLQAMRHAGAAALERVHNRVVEPRMR